MSRYLTLECILWCCCHGAAFGAPPVVTVSRPLVREISDYDFVGRLDPVENVAIRAGISGPLAQAFVKVGTTVRPGDKLFAIGTEAVGKKKESLDVAVLKAEARVIELTGELDAARKKTPPPTPGTLARLSAQRDVAIALRDIVRTALAQVEQELTQAEIPAPIAGQVQQVLASAGDPVVAGTRLAVIVPTDPARVTFEMDEPTLLRLQGLRRAGKLDGLVDVTVQLGIGKEEGYPHRGHLERLDNQVDAKTKTIGAQAVIFNADGRLTPTLLAEEKKKAVARVRVSMGNQLNVLLLVVHIVGHGPTGDVLGMVGPHFRLQSTYLDVPRQTLLVPWRAVGGRADGVDFVLVVNENNKVEERKVKAGAHSGGLQIIEEGLRATDRIVLRVGRPAEPLADDLPEVRTGPRDLRLLQIPEGTVVEPVEAKLSEAGGGARP